MHTSSHNVSFATIFVIRLSEPSRVLCCLCSFFLFVPHSFSFHSIPFSFPSAIKQKHNRRVCVCVYYRGQNVLLL